MRYEAMIDAVEAHGRSLIERGAQARPKQVPSCPGWDVARLLTHVAHVHDWAARNLAADPEDRVRMGRMREAPSDPAECAATLDVLLGALRSTYPEAQHAGPRRPRTASWWARRQLLETVVHRWDVENATGLPAEIDPKIAALGVTEFVEVFAGGAPMPVSIRCTDAELLLILWGRTTVDETRIDGDPEAYRSWRAAVAT